MCVAAVAWAAHPRWRLVIAGNRDEFHDRPAAPLARWEDGTIAGKDLQAGGTWLGLNEAGRLALVTNYRVDGHPKPGRPSRGGLVTDWLQTHPLGDIGVMNPFHLLQIAEGEAWHLTNYPTPARTRLSSGIHGLSNGGFDDRWTKTLRLESALADWLGQESDDPATLFAALRDDAPLSPGENGVGPLPGFTAVFIDNSTYGTRCSTVIAVDAAGQGTMIERRFAPDATPTGETTLRFRWANPFIPDAHVMNGRRTT